MISTIIMYILINIFTQSNMSLCTQTTPVHIIINNSLIVRDIYNL